MDIPTVSPGIIELQVTLAVVTIMGAASNVYYGIRLNGGRYWKQRYEEQKETETDLRATIDEIKKNKDNYKNNHNALLNDYNELMGEHRTCKHFDQHRYRDHQPLA